MRTIHILVIFVLLALAFPASPAHAGGVVTVCDEAHLLAALAGGGTVTFACSGVITLTETITIDADTTIDGNGQTVTISGDGAVGVFVVNSGVALNLNELTIANGNRASGGGIYNDRGVVTISNCTFSSNSADRGGGISNVEEGTLVVANSTFSNNHAAIDGGGIYNGGGTYTHGTLTVSYSTFFGNSASNSGGGIWNFSGTVTVSNSTFAGNTASGGGGILNSLAGAVTVTNSTFASNSAPFGGAGIRNDGYYSRVTLKNTIVANSLTGGNCFGPGIFTDGWGNLSYPDTTCPGVNNDPLLGPLQDNGGPTLTMALGPGSAAIDAAYDATCAAPPVNNCDQRGFNRPNGPHCDIGAVEAGSSPPLAVVLANFNVAVQSNHVLINWETVSELDNVGFNLYRASASDGADRAQLAFVPSQSPGNTQGAAYSYDDKAVQSGATYWYWLAEIDLSGATTLHGPVGAILPVPNAVTLTEASAAPVEAFSITDQPSSSTARLPTIITGLLLAVLVSAGVRRGRRHA
jgi:hypothetical protein